MTTRSWLDSSGRLMCGKHQGELLEDVVKNDRRYIEWVVDNVEDCDEGDLEIMNAQLAQAKRGR